jgi:hypothetical protein
VSALAEVVATVDETLRAHAPGELPAGRFEGKVSADRAYVLEAVYEGYLLHYRHPRVFIAMDADLRLLAGDALYALGLERLAERGDLVGIAELSDLISLCAWVEAEGRGELAEALWSASEEALSPSGGPGARARLRELLEAGGESL